MKTERFRKEGSVGRREGGKLYLCSHQTGQSGAKSISFYTVEIRLICINHANVMFYASHPDFYSRKYIVDLYMYTS